MCDIYFIRHIDILSHSFYRNFYRNSFIKYFCNFFTIEESIIYNCREKFPNETGYKLLPTLRLFTTFMTQLLPISQTMAPKEGEKRKKIHEKDRNSPSIPILFPYIQIKTQPGEETTQSSHTKILKYLLTTYHSVKIV